MLDLCSRLGKDFFHFPEKALLFFDPGTLTGCSGTAMHIPQLLCYIICELLLILLLVILLLEGDSN